MKLTHVVKSKLVLGLMLFVFSVMVSNQAFAAQANLAWDTISTYSDGTPMTNLGGYRIYSGTASKQYTNKVDVGNLTSYTLNSLTDGATYYFAITAYDTLGNESSYSNELSKSFATQASTYSLTATAGAGGTITAQGATANLATNGTSTISTVSVAQGASQTFTIAPITGYSIAAVSVDGASVGAVATYTFSNVTANHTLSATFTATAAPAPAPAPAPTPTPVPKPIPTTTAGQVVFATNAGGPAFKDATGVYFQADTKYVGGSTNSTTAAIPVTINDKLYQSWRWGNMSYNIPMANGNYSVTLKFSDWYSRVGQRIFNVAMQGVTVLSRFDIIAKSGGYLNPYDVTIPVTVSNGVLSIKFTNVVDSAKINAFVVKTR